MDFQMSVLYLSLWLPLLCIDSDIWNRHAVLGGWVWSKGVNEHFYTRCCEIVAPR